MPVTDSQKNINRATFFAPIIGSERMKIVLHFFPNLGPLSTPSPVSCSVRLFGKEKISSPISIDGLRLSQADSVPLNALFSSDFFRDYGQLAGLSIELSGARGIHHSQVYIEMRSLLATTQFLARPMLSPEGAALTMRQRFLPMAFEAGQVNRAIFLNPTGESIGVIPPHSVHELQCRPSVSGESPSLESSVTGLSSSMYSGAIAAVRIPSTHAPSFLFACDRSTQIPLHVEAL